MLALVFFCFANLDALEESAVTTIYKSQANRQAFDQFICKFEVTVGEVESSDNIRELTISKVKGNGTGLWAKNQMDELYVLTVGERFEGETVTGKDGLTYMSVPFAGGEMIMRSAQYEMRLAEPVGAGTVELRQQGQFVPEFDPFEAFQLFGSGESSEPGMFALMHLQSGLSPKPSVVDGSDLLKLSVGLIGGKGAVEFDKKKNCIVSKSEVVGDSYSSHWELINTFEIASVGSFPKVAVHVSGRNGIWPKKCIIWRATNFEMRAPLERELSYTTNSRYQLHRGNPKKLVYLETGETVSPDRMPMLYEDMAKGKRTLAKSSSSLRFSVGIVLVALTLSALFLWRRSFAN